MKKHISVFNKIFESLVPEASLTRVMTTYLIQYKNGEICDVTLNGNIACYLQHCGVADSEKNIVFQNGDTWLMIAIKERMHFPIILNLVTKQNILQKNRNDDTVLDILVQHNPGERIQRYLLDMYLGSLSSDSDRLESCNIIMTKLKRLAEKSSLERYQMEYYAILKDAHEGMLSFSGVKTSKWWRCLVKRNRTI